MEGRDLVSCTGHYVPCRQYVEHFFQCTECSQHFGAMAAEESAAAVASTRSALVWSWRAHNIVRAPH